MSISVSLGQILLLICLSTLIVVIGLLVLNWLFPLIETRSSDELQPDQARAIMAAGRTHMIVPPLVGRATDAQPGHASLAPGALRRYWRANVRLIGGLLLLWLGGSIVPVIFAPVLHRFELGGFPLDYYLGAQTSLLLFVVLIIGYGWATGRLERRFGTPRTDDIDSAPIRRRVLLMILAFAGLLLALDLIEQLGGSASRLVGWILLLVTLGFYAAIGMRSRSHSISEYYVAGRRIPALFNGMAIGADWMSAATFLALAGTLWRLGYEGLAYVMGWTGGYVLLALLIAPYLRRFGQFTVPDFIGARYGNGARIVAATISMLISFTYLTAQVTGVGIIMSQFLGVSYVLGVLIGLSAVLFCSFVGGMQAITWTQVVQCVILLIAYLVPIAWIAYRVTGVPIPQIMYGQALREITVLETGAGVGKLYTQPFNDWTPWNFVALTMCLMMGTAGLPHLLARCYTTQTVAGARRSVGWGIVFIVLLYSAIPAYAAFARREMLADVIGQSITQLPGWTARWAAHGDLHIVDQNGDGIVQPDELTIAEDVVVLATPDIAGLPRTIAALVAVGGLAAALSTADGLLMVIAAAAAHDLYFRMFSPRASPRKRLLVARSMVLLAALAAALVAMRQLAIIVQLVAWAFSVAAATIFPALVLGIFWKRTNGAGVIAGMIMGLITTLGYMITVFIAPDLAFLGINHVAAGIFGVPVNLVVTIIVSALTAAPPASARQLVDLVRSPELVE